VKRAAFVSCVAAAAIAVPAAAAPSNQAALAALERRRGGRLGVAALDTATGGRVAFRADERFAMCSTFKLPLTAAVLARVDAGRERLDRFVRYSSADLLNYAPITRAHLAAGGMTVSALCAAAIEYSDNTAANLLFASIGGPPALTRYVRGLGDTITRFDRTEPTLNTALPGDPRDTTTPSAMTGLANRILIGDALLPASRARLIGWLEASTTGATRIRAGIPRGWIVGDKTGTGDRHATNDVAIVRPPHRRPWLVAVYYVDSPASPAQRDAVLAGAARVVVGAFGD
jgi:beta-lactamase class A